MDVQRALGPWVRYHKQPLDYTYSTGRKPTCTLRAPQRHILGRQSKVTECAMGTPARCFPLGTRGSVPVAGSARSIVLVECTA